MTGDDLTVLVLGGTTEGRALAAVLHGQPGLCVVTSLAGRTRDPVPVAGQTLSGGFGGAEGLATWLVGHRPVVLVDATHPYAVVMTETASEAAEATGTPTLRLARPAWSEQAGDRWHHVPDAAAAATLLSTLGGRPLLTTGHGGLVSFTETCAQLPVLLRCVEPPAAALPGPWLLLLARGPFTLPTERILLAQHRADVLVTRDSGGDDAKLTAAREVGLPVVLLARPVAGPEQPQVTTVEDAVSWVFARI